MAELIEIKQVRSAIGRIQAQRATLRSLGLRKMHQTVVQPDRPEIRGMISRVAHLVEVRYPGDEAPLDIEPGQEPKGQGQPPAGPSVADDEAAERADALAETLAQEGSAPLGDLVQNAPTLTSEDEVDRPPAAPDTTADDTAQDAEAADEEPPADSDED